MSLKKEKEKGKLINQYVMLWCLYCANRGLAIFFLNIVYTVASVIVKMAPGPACLEHYPFLTISKIYSIALHDKLFERCFEAVIYIERS